MRVELKLGDGDGVGLASWQPGRVVEIGVVLREVVFAPDAAALAD